MLPIVAERGYRAKEAKVIDQLTVTLDGHNNFYDMSGTDAFVAGTAPHMKSAKVHEADLRHELGASPGRFDRPKVKDHWALSYLRPGPWSRVCGITMIPLIESWYCRSH